ncbi:MAG: tRNA guanosine(34) transglycosylase Tgt [Bacteroidota bacterium]|nr:tRNA guanosine(34) transglycosylase Tgt [Bacteroidota bacterium]
MASLTFELTGKDLSSSARAGLIRTDHGQIPTPIFMPVGTTGSVKAVTCDQLRHEVDARIILGNTYHLYLRPGTAVLENAGGLHRFMNWNGPLLTDSGGYQVFSLAETRKISEEGVIFKSHIDGSQHMFSPEKVMDIQRAIGGDIVMAFDECPAFGTGYEYAEKSMHLTHRWLDRCFSRFNETPDRYGSTQNLFPIVQGGIFENLRRESCGYIAEKNAPGNAIGGLSVGEPDEELYAMTALCCENLPKEKPRYLMGVGSPWNLLECIGLGIDMFDCVMPTRNGRNGMLFTSKGVINIDNKKWEHDFSPIDDGIECSFSNQYSKAYLRHLLKSKELTGLTIASVHNLAFYLHLVKQAREHIIAGDYSIWKSRQTGILKERL